MNPLKKVAEAVISRVIPLDLVYYLNGQEIFRETRTAAQMKQEGLTVGPILTWMREAGMEPAGELTRDSGGDGLVVLTCPVRYDGCPGSFSVTLQARMP